MPRPRRGCKMNHPPSMKGFKPFGTPFRETEQIRLLLEEYESIRLTDYDGFNHEKAAAVMNISRPTFTRIYEKARQKVATAFAENKSIVFEGGNVVFDKNWYRCDNCNQTFSKAESETITNCPDCKSGEVFLINMEHTKGKCYCFNCKTTISHVKGIPCRSTKCPNCGEYMKRVEDNSL